jgi:hypothetical protein
VIWWAFIVDSPHLAVRWLPSGRRHVFLARHLASTPEGEVWQVVDPRHDSLRTELVLQDRDLVAQNVADGAVAVALPVRADGRPYWRGWMTCVGLVKYATGLRWPLVWTPGQLIARAEREGFEVRRPC